MNKTVLYGSLLSVMAVATVLCSTARGQPYFERVESLEWRAADSKVIVRATIDQIDRELVEDDATVYVWDTVTVKVHETLKGAHQPTIKCLVRDGFPRDRPPGESDEDLARWKEERQELLLFFVPSKRLKKVDPKYAEHKLTLRPAEYSRWKDSCVVLDKTAESNVRTLDLQVLTDPQVILERARAAIAAAAETKPAGKHVVRWPGTIPVSHYYVLLTVPVDHRLETAARRWIESPHDYLPGRDDRKPEEGLSGFATRAWWPRTENEWPTTENGLKAEGIKALRHFKSDKNVALLETLLGDTASYCHTVEEEKWAAVRQREYFIRQEAYAALQQWGVKVSEPVLRERLLRKVTDPEQRAAITWIESLGGDVEYHEMEAPGAGPFRTVKVVVLAFVSINRRTAASVRDLSPLSSLQNLETLVISFAPVRDLTPLSKLTNLQRLGLSDTRVTDLSPLAELKNLKTLQLGRPISDISPLAGLAKLESLDLGAVRVRDLTPLAKLDRLQRLDLSHTPVRDLSPLSGLTNLVDLNLRDTRVSRLPPLSGLKNLKRLNLGQTRASDLAPLAELKSLENLDLQHTPVSDVAPLAELEHLEWLDLSNTQVSDVSPLENMKGLHSVFLNNTPLGDEGAKRFKDSLRD